MSTESLLVTVTLCRTTVRAISGDTTLTTTATGYTSFLHAIGE